VDVSESASISTGIASRYATAVFEMAKESKAVKKIEADLDALTAAVEESADLRALISSPVYSREQMGSAMAGLAKAMKLTPIMSNTLGLMAQNRRLFVVPHLIAALRALIAEDKGEVTAEVVTAKALTKAQSDKLAKSLKAAVGKDVKINAAVDEKIIGGLIVKVGSKMIDTSIRSKLNNLQNAMKEVG
jgi:F-type H+-transporting ATPase subunit delta